MPTHDIEAILISLIQTGLDAVGSRLTVEYDGDAIYLRTLCVVFTDLGRIQCYEISSPEIPMMDFPMDAVQAAAVAVVVNVLTGVVARAIESDELSRI
ncbi:hypothetical protein G6L37_03425 [Agrobacterium rubi]|nr:hypothetical protein [Agrobacterium rubi]NTF24422.1 hypothetical protein [Agrobacterium rubi]